MLDDQPVQPVGTTPMPTPSVPTPAPTPLPATPPPAAIGPEPQETVTTSGRFPAFVWNDRTKDITIWSIVASVALSYFDAIGGYFSGHFLATAILDAIDSSKTISKGVNAMPISFDFISPLKGGLISGLITAAVLYFLYPQIISWLQKQSWGKFFDSFFKVVFYPYLAVAVVFTILGSFLNLMVALVILIFTTVGHFVYALILDKKIGHHFMPQGPQS